MIEQLTPSDVGELVLDGTKLAWHLDRVREWEAGKRIAPITIDMALTRACQYGCKFCYSALQENAISRITEHVMENFLTDCAELGVKAVSFVSDGESTLSPVFPYAVRRGYELGLSMASGTNAQRLTPEKAEAVLPYLTYLRVNFSAGEAKRYAEIMGCKEAHYWQVCHHVRHMVEFKRKHNLPVTLGLQMVLMPEDADQIMPMARLGKVLGVDYTVIKHCSDNERGDLGVNYAGYAALTNLLREAEEQSEGTYKCVVKWNKINAQGTRSYQRCYGPPFLLQISGSGLVAPCGMLFHEEYKQYHIGNITKERFKDIVQSDRYWEVMKFLSSEQFNAQKMCGTLCLQHHVNETLDNMAKGKLTLSEPSGAAPQHLNFV